MTPFLLLIVVVILFTFGVVFLLANWFYAGFDRNEQARRGWTASGLFAPTALMAVSEARKLF